MRWSPPARTGLTALLGTALALPAGPAPAPPGTYPVTPAALRAAGPPYAGWADAGRRFLRFDPRGDGLAVEVLGDLATADRIAVLVPGVGSTLRDFDRGLGGVPGRAPARQARDLYAALRAGHPGARVAVLAWLGYDPPDGVATAAGPAAARRGAPALRTLLRELAAPGVRITLVGHSYGALVAGLAARDVPAQVTDLVTLGGIGAGVDRADALPGVRVWAAEAATDWIRRVPELRLAGLGHGVRPGDPAFGARRLPVAGVAGHDGYLAPGGVTLAAVAAVVRDGALPSAADLTDSPRAGALPAGALPAGAVPAGAVPAGAVPAGAVPAGAVPASAVPAGAPATATGAGR
ncbi:alpha/beta hydrolase family protein [Micromonospora sp. PLK6-60]|uniref:alpha/beta hydrolase n=1 Tax=Micromonospora sp. PLK6-60 TaxID=2873383 RepID=UPI001CA779F8|nr:alpha/beta hydrolase [Micromonospora sp. PLK6-60]MBY8872535.1 alpha/beta hydrolase family protein [Micromonospora sp. PLK6-60]